MRTTDDAPAGEGRATDPATLVVFGATGDLTRRKLVPALFSAYARGRLPDRFSIVAFARRDHSDATFREMMAAAIGEFARVEADEEAVARFVERIDYHRGDVEDPAAYARLRERLGEARRYPENRIFHLSVNPSLFEPAVRLLEEAGLVAPAGGPFWTRVVIEKPFGRDLASAVALNASLLRWLDESQMYRIDHYLGKETVQNVLSFRFANAIFEPVFNRGYVDHVQIVAAETVGMEAGRGGYYDAYGALRDMASNHLLQLLCLVAMEPPGSLSADAVRNEKVKVLDALRPDDAVPFSDAVVRGRYLGGATSSGTLVPGYLEEARIAPDSTTETFVALRLRINNWRWAGVPFLLRTGKRMPRKSTEISIVFKVPPLRLFSHVECDADACDLVGVKPNVLTFRIQPDEGVFLRVSAKRPDMRFGVEDVALDFSYSDRWENALPEAYERLLLDVFRGDATLFTRSDEVEAEWRVMQPVLDRLDRVPVEPYPAFTWGPTSADRLLRGLQGGWRNPA